MEDIVRQRVTGENEALLTSALVAILVMACFVTVLAIVATVSIIRSMREQLMPVARATRLYGFGGDGTASSGSSEAPSDADPYDGDPFPIAPVAVAKVVGNAAVPPKMKAKMMM